MGSALSSVSVRKVPFFNYQFDYLSEKSQIDTILQSVCARGAFILQRDLEEFEELLAKFAGCNYAIGVANGTDAITLALVAAGAIPGEEAIFCSHTFIATASAIYHAGLIPVPVECQADRTIDPKAVEAAITSRTKFIVPTQLNGRTCNMDALMDIAHRNNLQIVEDAAQGLGSKFKGQSAGTFGTAGTISLYPAKSLGCYGDGGAILTNDKNIYEKIKILRDHGRDTKGEVVAWGWNSRLDNLQAAILNHKIKTFDDVIDRRRSMAACYCEQLAEVSEINLPPAPQATGENFDTFQNFEIDVDRRDELQKFLKDRGIGTILQWGGKAVHQFPGLGFKCSLPFTERFFQRCLLLPLNISLADDDINYVAQAIRQFYGY